jgi:hypothetical protein
MCIVCKGSVEYFLEDILVAAVSGEIQQGAIL